MSLTESQLSLLKNDHTLFPALNITQKSDLDKALKANGLSIQYIKMPTKRQKLIALEQNPEALAFISDVNAEAIEEAIKSEPNVIQYVSEPSVYQQLLAISIFGPVFHFIKVPSDEAKILAAIKQEIRLCPSSKSEAESSLYQIYLLCLSLIQIQKF